MKHELFEELEAFDPKWQTHYPTILAAASAANVEGLYRIWLANTVEGKDYFQRMKDVADTAGAIKRAQDSAERLPFGLGNLGAEK